MSPLLHLENLDQVFKQEMRLLVNVTALAAEVALAICHIHLSPRGSSGECEMNTISQELFYHFTLTTHSAILPSCKLRITSSGPTCGR